MDERALMHKILMGEFPFTLPHLEQYLHQGEELRLFAGEKLDQSIIERKFLLYVWQGKGACVITRPDRTTFRFLTMGEKITCFSNIITPYTEYSQSWDIMALENTVLVAFAKEQVYAFLKEDPVLSEEYMEFASTYHTVMQRRVLLTANLTSSQRVLTWLYGLCGGCCDRQTCEIPCTLNQQEIADILLVHISTCNKIFAWLQENGVAAKTKSKLCIDVPKLRQYIMNDWKIY
ncbi:Crp/Fnr family transcriptional regulator [Oscillibacter hominis]|uniref:Crp/Fnr family transcriptional regulator n=1 Tax=Oscillibacter hominis TaxID=2763056 RepID=A0A7G9B818_9FIRM|nr:Crp/Fnr family transcriptional regulator [Oscillibacter hominis]QNL45699.1 Crp/Fnr family transcriptional regulator [Oscillibacter hominis]